MSVLGKFSKPRFVLAYALAPALFLTARTTDAGLRVGIAIAALGEFLRIWANGYVGHVKVNQTDRASGRTKIGRLITAGPYAFVRHPLYLGSFLLGAGFCVMVGNIWLSVIALAAFLVIYRKKMAEEEASIHAEWGPEGERYHRSVPQWLPNFRRYANRRGQWSWQGIIASQEWKTLVWVVVLTIALSLRKEYAQEHRLFQADRWARHAALLGFAVLLMAADGIFEFMKRTKRAKVV